MAGSEAFIQERYRILAEACRRRGIPVKPLPGEPTKAVNLVYELAAKLNGRDPLGVKYSKTSLVIEEKE